MNLFLINFKENTKNTINSNKFDNSEVIMVFNIQKTATEFFQLPFFLKH